MQRHEVPSLPAELLHEIVLLSSRETLSNLCLVSQKFSAVACPVLFSRVSLGGFTPRLRDKTAQLRALSNGDTKASALARHLSINYSSSFPDDPGRVLTLLEEAFLKYSKSAIGSFRAITAISWKILGDEPEFVIDSILNSLTTFPALKEINLNYSKHTFYIGNLGGFSNLHKIRVRDERRRNNSVQTLVGLPELLAQCPALTDLAIFAKSRMSLLFRSLKHVEKPLSLQNLSMDEVTVYPNDIKSAIHHLRSLESLHLYRSNHLVKEPRIWDILIQEKIYIRNILTDVVDDSLLEYLSSFQGLRKLSLNNKKSLPSVDILQAMIPRHAESLLKLNIDCILPCSEAYANLLSSFINLRCFTCRLAFAKDYIPIIKNALSTCARIFPKLERLFLHTSISPSFSIHAAITNCRFDEFPIALFEIECEHVIFKPHKDEIAGSVTYVTSGCENVVE